MSWSGASIAGALRGADALPADLLSQMEAANDIDLAGLARRLEPVAGRAAGRV